MNRVVYTALFGGYEPLGNPCEQEPPPGVRFVCFTDRDDLVSPVWDLVQVEPPVWCDPVRSARMFKIHGHPLVHEADESLWIDNTITLRGDVRDLFDDWLGDADAAMPLHDHRDTVRDEYRAVLAAGYDEPYLVRSQLHQLEREVPEVLDERPLWTALVARRNTPAVRRFERFWGQQVMRRSRRDQLSVNLAVALSGLDVKRVELPNLESSIHRWARTRDLPKNASIRFASHQAFQYSASDWASDRWQRSTTRRRLRWLQILARRRAAALAPRS